MRISPPIAILLILAVVVAGIAWLSPAPNEATEVAVLIPMATYQKLTLEAQSHADANGRTMTVEQYIRSRLSK